MRRRYARIVSAKDKRLRDAFNQAKFRAGMLRYGLIGILEKGDVEASSVLELREAMNNFCEALETEEATRGEFYGRSESRVVVRRVRAVKTKKKANLGKKEGATA